MIFSSLFIFQPSFKVTQFLLKLFLRHFFSSNSRLNTSILFLLLSWLNSFKIPARSLHFHHQLLISLFLNLVQPFCFSDLVIEFLILFLKITVLSLQCFIFIGQIKNFHVHHSQLSVCLSILHSELIFIGRFRFQNVVLLDGQQYFSLFIFQPSFKVTQFLLKLFLRHFFSSNSRLNTSILFLLLSWLNSFKIPARSLHFHHQLLISLFLNLVQPFCFSDLVIEFLILFLKITVLSLQCFIFIGQIKNFHVHHSQLSVCLSILHSELIFIGRFRFQNVVLLDGQQYFSLFIFQPSFKVTQFLLKLFLRHFFSSNSRLNTSILFLLLSWLNSFKIPARSLHFHHQLLISLFLNLVQPFCFSDLVIEFLILFLKITVLSLQCFIFIGQIKNFHVHHSQLSVCLSILHSELIFIGRFRFQNVVLLDGQQYFSLFIFQPSFKVTQFLLKLFLRHFFSSNSRLNTSILFLLLSWLNSFKIPARSLHFHHQLLISLFLNLVQPFCFSDLVIEFLILFLKITVLSLQCFIFIGQIKNFHVHHSQLSVCLSILHSELIFIGRFRFQNVVLLDGQQYFSLFIFQPSFKVTQFLLKLFLRHFFSSNSRLNTSILFLLLSWLNSFKIPARSLHFHHQLLISLFLNLVQPFCFSDLVIEFLILFLKITVLSLQCFIFIGQIKNFHVHHSQLSVCLSILHSELIFIGRFRFQNVVLLDGQQYFSLFIFQPSFKVTQFLLKLFLRHFFSSNSRLNTSILFLLLSWLNSFKIPARSLHFHHQLLISLFLNLVQPFCFSDLVIEFLILFLKITVLSLQCFIFIGQIKNFHVHHSQLSVCLSILHSELIFIGRFRFQNVVLLDGQQYFSLFIFQPSFKVTQFLLKLFLRHFFSSNSRLNTSILFLLLSWLNSFKIPARSLHFHHQLLISLFLNLVQPFCFSDLVIEFLILFLKITVLSLQCFIFIGQIKNFHVHHSQLSVCLSILHSELIFIGRFRFQNVVLLDGQQYFSLFIFQPSFKVTQFLLKLFLRHFFSSNSRLNTSILFLLLSWLNSFKIPARSLHFHHQLLISLFLNLVQPFCFSDLVIYFSFILFYIFIIFNILLTF